MKKTRAVFIITISLIIFSSFYAAAQSVTQLGIKWYSKDIRLDLGGSWGMPTSYLVSPAVDADVRLQKDFSISVSGLLSFGYTHFLQNDASVSSEFRENMGFFPAKAGAKLYLKERVYISTEVGTAFKTSGDAPASFIYAPGVGFEFEKGVDCGLRYESYTKYNMTRVALKVAYGFTLKHRTKYTSWYK